MLAKIIFCNRFFFGLVYNLEIGSQQKVTDFNDFGSGSTLVGNAYADSA